MSNYRRANAKGGAYFFTVVTYRRQRFLCDEDVRCALRESIKAVRAFTINAWVLLPDYLHCIWTLPPNDADFGVRWAMIKRFVTKQCGVKYKREEWMTSSKRKRKESTFWQRRFWEHQIRDEQDYERRMDYLHVNPVKHGLVEKVADWPHSTFHRYVDQGVYPVDWAGIIDECELDEDGEPKRALA